MGKDAHLINIYLKIHNKHTLTMDDLRYLAQYAPDCFEKTCKNVVYNFPEATHIMEPDLPAPSEAESLPQATEQQSIEKILENIKRLETKELPVSTIDAEQVKNLLGNLYMELLFPHNDKASFMSMPADENTTLFDRRV